MYSSIRKEEDSKGNTLGWNLDAKIDPVEDDIEVRTYPSASGFNLAIDHNGRTIIRIGGFKERPEIKHE